MVVAVEFATPYVEMSEVPSKLLFEARCFLLEPQSLGSPLSPFLGITSILGSITNQKWTQRPGNSNITIIGVLQITNYKFRKKSTIKNSKSVDKNQISELKIQILEV